MDKSFSDVLLKRYLEYNSLVKQQIDSYNKFLDEGMQEVVNNIGVVETNVEGFQIKLGKIVVETPRFYELRGGYTEVLPVEARIRNITYASPVFLEMIPIYNGVEKPTYDKVYIGEIPVMVRSKICHTSHMSESELIEIGMDPRDPGGYFIINGSERVLVSLEDLVPNKVLVTVNDDGSIIAKVFSVYANFRARCSVRRTKEGSWVIDFPSATPGITLMSVLRALGAKKDKDIESLFNTDKLIIANDLYYNLDGDQSKENPEEYLAKRLSPGQPKEYQLTRMWYLLDNYLLPHLGKEEKDREKKMFYLARMAERTTLVHHKKLMPDDKDHYGNKRIKLAGDLMKELFAYAFNYFIKDLVYQASRANVRGRKLQVHTLVRQGALTDRILYSMGTGNWIAGQTGVSQLLDRTSFLSSLSHRRRHISPLSKKHPHFKARDLHGTQYGKVCPSETPEGPPTSLVKNFSIFGEITIGTDESVIQDICKKLGVRG